MAFEDGDNFYHIFQSTKENDVIAVRDAANADTQFRACDSRHSGKTGKILTFFAHTPDKCARHLAITTFARDIARDLDKVPFGSIVEKYAAHQCIFCSASNASSEASILASTSSQV